MKKQFAHMIPVPSPTPHSTTASTVVLDTNVCLDLFVFRDQHTLPIMQALQSGQIRAVTRAECRDEWLAVLHYRHLPLNDDNRPLAQAEFDQYIELIAPPVSGVRLPVCSDKDDQKFLELARDANVQYLITKDKALLKLAKKTARAGMFTILLPQKWSAK